MKRTLKILFLVVVFNINAAAQNAGTDSLRKLLEKTQADSNRVILLQKIAGTFYFSKPDSCLVYSLKARDLAKSLKMVNREATALNSAGEASRFIGDYPGALKFQFDALKLSREIKDRETEGASLGYIGFTYSEIGENRLALQYLSLSTIISKELSNKIRYTFDLTNIGHVYDLLNIPDSALYYQLKANESYIGLKHGPLRSLTLIRLGNAYAHNGQPDSALAVYYRALANSILAIEKVNLPNIQAKIAGIYSERKNYDSSIWYARNAFENGKNSAQKLVVMESSELLSRLYSQLHKYDSAFFFQEQSIAMKDSLYGAKKIRQLQLHMLEEQQRTQAEAQEQQDYRNKIRYTLLIVAIAVFLLISFLLLRNNRLQKKAKLKVETAFNELKDTQQQLVQREKMASLGELTAGIAHEIQNPLNFVNNFSGVSTELIDEMKTEIDKGNFNEAKSIATDLKQNLEKINHHGQRAGDIVKSMLQHSRSSSATKELTDINKLADEYLRLAYHGLRAKDKTFNATMKTEFDDTITNINIIPQDIGRVILNLITNAFYAVNERRSKEGKEYEPTVSLSTKKKGENILISVKDNGNGIQQKILDKIFQPFFTTKPTGKGTGLGLSLSYDIIKAHDGDIKVDTKENEGTEFTIQLPVSSKS